VSATIRIGTQGWSYVDWNGVFYPPGSKQEDRLPFYASVFDSVELDTTFYTAPKPTIARSWARHTPEHFRFDRLETEKQERPCRQDCEDH